jgi:hypothetical protein
MSLLGATILTAIATLALAVFAFITAIFAWLAFRKQSREVAAIERQVADEQEHTRQQAETLRLQADELKQVAAEREREAAERRRAQAAQVYMWEVPIHAEAGGKALPEMTVAAYVRNTSPQPIYDLRLRWEALTFDDRQATAETYLDEAPLMPDATASARVPVPIPTGLMADPRDVSVVATFRDRAGLWWRARPDGHLEELPGRPAELPPSADDWTVRG